MMRALFWLALLGIAAYIGYQYGMPQVRAWRYHDVMSQTAKLAGEMSDGEVRTELLTTARELEVPLSERRLAIRRSGGRLHVTASWEEVVRLQAGPLGPWVDTLHYAYEVDEVPLTPRLR
jgi:hypothetical protein